MAEAYVPVLSQNLHPGFTVLIPPATGRHRSRGAIDGSSHMTIREVRIDHRWGDLVDVVFTDCEMTLRFDVTVNVIARH